MTIPALSDKLQQDCLKDLSTQGFTVIPDFLEPNACDRLSKVINDFIVSQPDKVKGGHTSDDRIFAAEYLDPVIREYKYHPGIKRIASTYVGTEQDTLMTMANRVKHREGVAIRSGGRWHRDRKKIQFKSMVYLSDVTDQNGPFSILPKSAIGTHEYVDEVEKAYFTYEEQRWDDSAIAAFLELVRTRMQVLTGAKGTLVLFDSSLIHSGQKIKAASRYALTNYMYTKAEIDLGKMRSKWTTSAGLIDF